MRLITKEYNVNGSVNKKIVLLTDIHYHSKKDVNYLNKVLDKIKKIDCDYICLSGDNLDQAKVSEEDEFINFLIRLSKIALVLVGIGNHDITIKHEYYKNVKLFDKIKSIDNLIVLDNEYYIDSEIVFHGVTLPTKFYYVDGENDNCFSKYVNKTNIKPFSDKYNILLMHTPISISRNSYLKDNKFDLVLCGHVHGGLLPNFLKKLFKGRGLINPQKELFAKNSYGIVKKYNSNIIISSGITKLSSVNPMFILKFLYAGEISVINIKKGQ